MWQDQVIAACQVGAIFALLPIIFGKDKPSAITSFMNFGLAGTVAITLSTLHLKLAVVTAALISLSWLIIGIQKLRGTRH